MRLRFSLASVFPVVMVCLFPCVSAAQQEPPHFPESFGNLVSPRSVDDELKQAMAATRAAPVPATMAATVEFDEYLAIAGVGWLPKGTTDVRLVRLRGDGAEKPAVLATSSGFIEEVVRNGVGRLFLIRLDELEGARSPAITALSIRRTDGQEWHVAVSELPRPPRR